MSEIVFQHEIKHSDVATIAQIVERAVRIVRHAPGTVDGLNGATFQCESMTLDAMGVERWHQLATCHSISKSRGPEDLNLGAGNFQIFWAYAHTIEAETEKEKLLMELIENILRYSCR